MELPIPSIYGGKNFGLFLYVSKYFSNFSSLPRALPGRVPYAPCAIRASCPICLVPYVLSCPTRLEANALSCPTCLAPYMLSCHACLVSYMVLCPTCLVTYVLSCFMCFVLHVPRILHDKNKY